MIGKSTIFEPLLKEQDPSVKVLIQLIPMIHYIGYGALVLNLISMTMKDVLRLRWLSLSANAIYIVYGLLLEAPPLIIGCSIAVGIHGYHIRKITKSQRSQS